MLPPIPNPIDYQVSVTTGFLPSTPPLATLSDPVYSKWELILSNLQSLILSKRLRPVIDKLPIIPATHLDNEPEWRRAYLVLTFLAHSYIWSGDKPTETLPPPITYPLLQVCTHLDLPPVATYAGLVLWNYKPLFLNDSLSLSNLSTHATFTGSLDEQWFYLVSVAIEAKGGSSIPLLLSAITAARDNNPSLVTQNLKAVAEIIDELGSLLIRMYDSCDPHVFYHRIRPYLAGSKNMKDAGLPNGIFYDAGPVKPTEWPEHFDKSRKQHAGEHQAGMKYTPGWHQYGGGSNAQSSLLQFFDIVLGVEHRPTGTTATGRHESESDSDHSPAVKHSFIHEMRGYMPGSHRRFLQAVEEVANIREYVLFARNRELTVAYDACLAMLRALRDKHIQIVSRYIIVKSREVRSLSRPRVQRSVSPVVERQKGEIEREQGKEMRMDTGENGQMKALADDEISPATAPTRGRGIASIDYKDKKKKMRGTGGTALIPFLKQARDETGEKAVDDWARKVLTGSRRTPADVEVDIESLRIEAEDIEYGLERTVTVGLAGSWDMETEGGGLCAY